MSDTPLTDTNIEIFHRAVAGDYAPFEYVAAEFARDMERRLTAAEKARDEAQHSLGVSRDNVTMMDGLLAATREDYKDAAQRAEKANDRARGLEEAIEAHHQACSTAATVAEEDQAHDRLWAALAGARDGWREMDSAPKDGTEILAWIPWSQPLPRSKGYIGMCRWSDELEGFRNSHGGHWVEPVRWQPMPIDFNAAGQPLPPAPENNSEEVG